MIDNKKRTMNMKNNTFAIDAAPAAIPPKPNSAAIRAITKNVTVQRNIALDFMLMNILFESDVEYIKYRAMKYFLSFVYTAGTIVVPICPQHLV